MKLYELINASNNVMPALVTQKLSGGTAIKLALNSRLIQQQVEVFEKTRLEFAKRYGEDQGDGSFHIVSMVEFNAAITEMVETEVEVNFHLLSAQDIEQLSISSFEMSSILWMIQDVV
jgi:hypothetical protein